MLRPTILAYNVGSMVTCYDGLHELKFSVQPHTQNHLTFSPGGPRGPGSPGMVLIGGFNIPKTRKYWTSLKDCS